MIIHFDQILRCGSFDLIGVVVLVQDGNWDDVSGETFLRELLSTPIEETNWGKQVVGRA